MVDDDVVLYRAGPSRPSLRAEDMGEQIFIEFSFVVVVLPPPEVELVEKDREIQSVGSRHSRVVLALLVAVMQDVKRLHTDT